MSMATEDYPPSDPNTPASALVEDLAGLDAPAIRDWAAYARTRGWAVFIRAAVVTVPVVPRASGRASGLLSSVDLTFRVSLMRDGQSLGVATAMAAGDGRTAVTLAWDVGPGEADAMRHFLAWQEAALRTSGPFADRSGLPGADLAAAIAYLVLARLIEARVRTGERFRDQTTG